MIPPLPMRGLRVFKPCACAAAILLGACAATPPAPKPGVQVLVTDDLAIVLERVEQAVAQHGADDVLVALDLDNTLMAMETELGADQWYDWQRGLQQADACDERLVADRLAVQGALFHLGAMRPTQPDAPELVEAMQATGASTMLLTARGESFRLATFRELRRNGYDFRASAPGPAGGFERAYVPSGGSRPVRYEDGAYLLAGQHKGDMLIELLDRLGVARPSLVILADDKDKNVAAVREALEREGIAGALYRYSREDDRVVAFDDEQAAADWQALGQAARTVQRVMGAHNFELPAGDRPDGCQ